MAFFISRGFVKTGLGRRIALQFVKLFGKRLVWLIHLLVLILSYLLLRQVIQHVLVVLCFQSLSLCQSHFGSSPRDGSERKGGCVFNLYWFQGNLITSAMFLTAMAGNPIAQSLAEKRHTFKLHG